MGCNHCHVRFLGSGIFIVGFDLHLKEFKTLLLKKELLLLLLVAPWLQKDHFGRNASLGLGN